MQHQASAVETHLNGRRGDAKCFSSLLYIALFQFAKDEDFAVGKRKREEGAANEGADLLALKNLRGDLAPVGHQLGCHFAFAIVVEGVGEGGLGAAETASGLVEDDADEPGAEAGFGAELTQVAVRLEEGFLCGVFRIGFVMVQSESHEVDAAFVGADEFMEEFVVTGEDSRDHRGLFLLTSR